MQMHLLHICRVVQCLPAAVRLILWNAMERFMCLARYYFNLFWWKQSCWFKSFLSENRSSSCLTVLSTHNSQTMLTFSLDSALVLSSLEQPVFMRTCFLLPVSSFEGNCWICYPSRPYQLQCIYPLNVISIMGGSRIVIPLNSGNTSWTGYSRELRQGIHLPTFHEHQKDICSNRG